MSETKTVLDCKYTREWTGSYGTMHDFKVTLNDGDYTYTSKSKDQNKVVIGQEITFDVTQNEYGRKIKLVQDNQGNNSSQGNQKKSYGKSPEELDRQLVSFAASYAKDIVVAKISGPHLTQESIDGMSDNFTKWADHILQWMKSKTQ